MAIQPISSANLRNNNISFGIRKETRENKTGFLKASTIAVPLSTLIALSPLNTSQADAKNKVFGDVSPKIEMVDSYAEAGSVSGVNQFENLKTYKKVSLKGDNGEKYILLFKSKNMDGKIQSLEALVGDDKYASSKSVNAPKGSKEAYLSEGYHLSTLIGEVRPVKMRIISDDNQEGPIITFNQLLMKKGKDDYGLEYTKGISSEKISNYVKDFVDGKIPGLVNDGAVVKGEPIDVKVSPGSFGNLQNGVNTDNAWKRVGKYAKQDFGTLMLETDIKTGYGNYTLRAYNNDENSDDFEVVTVQKEGEGEFEVAKLESCKIHFSDYASIGTVDLGYVNLYKALTRKTKVARIVDDILFNTLVEVMNDTRFNSAYNLKKMKTEMGFVNRGVIYTYDE